jgi:hypothetical protein
MTYPSGGFACQTGYPGRDSLWRGGTAVRGAFRAAVHPAVWSPAAGREAVSRRGWIEAGMDPSGRIGAQHNKRLELTPPASGSITFVNCTARRRSSAAYR